MAVGTCPPCHWGPHRAPRPSLTGALPRFSKGEIQFREEASCQVLTSGFTVLEGSGSQVFGEEASSTGKAGSTASFRLECAQGTELAGCKAIRGIFTRLAQTWGDQ